MSGSLKSKEKNTKEKKNHIICLRDKQKSLKLEKSVNSSVISIFSATSLLKVCQFSGFGSLDSTC